MLWRRLDEPGHEWARLSGSPGPHGAPILRGTAIFSEDRIPGRLDYKIRCNAAWETLDAQILGWVGEAKIKLWIERSPDNSWMMNGLPVPEVRGCVDIDLSFSPSTNLLPIRRLNLEIDQQAEVRAAWLIFPDMKLNPLVHRFRREDEHRYFYDSDTGFSTELKTGLDGFVSDYPPFWREEKDA
jgi:hypothetical protein